jgi:hypothetical protein
VAPKAASVPAAKTEWEVSIVRTAGPPTATKGRRLLVVIDCSQSQQLDLGQVSFPERRLQWHIQ